MTKKPNVAKNQKAVESNIAQCLTTEAYIKKINIERAVKGNSKGKDKNWKR